MPQNSHNQQLGNFMIQLRLLNVQQPTKVNVNDQIAFEDYVMKNGTSVYTSSRPAILPYKSRWTRLLELFIRMPLIITDFASESQKLVVPLLEDFYDSYSRPITHAHMIISHGSFDPKHILQVYSAKLRIDAHFYGLRYLMYHLALPSALIFVSAMALFILVVLFSVWLYLTYTYLPIMSPEKEQQRQEETQKMSAALHGSRFEDKDEIEQDQLPTPPPSDFPAFQDDEDSSTEDEEESGNEETKGSNAYLYFDASSAESSAEEDLHDQSLSSSSLEPRSTEDLGREDSLLYDDDQEDEGENERKEIVEDRDRIEVEQEHITEREQQSSSHIEVDSSGQEGEILEEEKDSSGQEGD